MISAWTKRFLFGWCFVLPVACVVSVGDDGDIDDGLGGTSGGSSVAGSGGSSAGSSSGGSSGEGGSAGSSSAGAGGSDSIPTPVCTDEDTDDECIACIKQQCCVEWQGCNTVTCQDQSDSVIACALENMGDAELYNDVCIPEAAEPDDFLAENAQALMTCINERIPEGDAGLEITRCGVPCFGIDIFMD